MQNKLCKAKITHEKNNGKTNCTNSKDIANYEDQSRKRKNETWNYNHAVNERSEGMAAVSEVASGVKVQRCAGSTHTAAAC